MGALAAYLTRGAGPRPDVIARMLDAVPHRGSVRLVLVHGQCTIGVSHADGEPDADLAISEGVAVAIAGVVDNLAEIVSSLDRQNGDSEFSISTTLGRAFRRFGTELPARLRGAYSILISDGTTLHCFRDHIGSSPLFYRDDDRGFFTASEAKQIIAGAEIPAEPDLEVVERIYYGDVDDDMPSALRGVRRLPKASVLSTDGGRLSVSRYWRPEKVLETTPFPADELRPRFEALMTQAVTRALTGNDVMTLSGGIDSPGVAAFAAPVHLRMSGRPLSAISAVFPGFPAVDEREYTELVSGELGIELHTFEPRARPLDGIADWVRLADGPFPSTSLAEAAEIYGMARNLGFRNILTGELAELVMAMDADVFPYLISRRRVRAALSYLRAERSRGVRFSRLGRRLISALAPDKLIRSYERQRYGPRRRSAVDWVTIPPARSASAQKLTRRQRWPAAQTRMFVSPSVSAEADEINQSICGVRVRRPWADVDLWEFFLGLPAQTKFPSARRKDLPRQLLRGWVPERILGRRTKTFFDEAVLARIEYPVLRRWLISPQYRMPGVDYRSLAERLNREDLDVRGFIWARDLTAVHAFLGLW